MKLFKKLFKIYKKNNITQSDNILNIGMLIKLNFAAL